MLIGGLAFGVGVLGGTVERWMLEDVLPYDKPDRLLWLAQESDTGDDRLSVQVYKTLSAMTDTFDGTAAFFDRDSASSVSTVDGPQRARVAVVEPALFGVLGFRGGLVPRFHNEADGMQFVASAEFCDQSLGSAARIGAITRIDGVDRALAGCTPRAFRFPAAVEIWLPLDMDDPRIATSHTTFLRAIVRLRAGITLDEARARVQRTFNATYNRDPAVITLRPVRDVAAAATIQQARGIQIAAVLVAVTALANAAVLCLATARRRRLSAAVRMCLGASRAHIAHVFAIEVAMLFGVGAFVFGAAAFHVSRAMALVAPMIGQREMLMCALKVAALGALGGYALGVPIALLAICRGGDTSGILTCRERLRAKSDGVLSTLIVCQLVSAVVLAYITALFWAHWRDLGLLNISQDAGQVIFMPIQLRPGRYPSSGAAATMYAQLLETLQSISGVRSVALTSSLPAQRNPSVESLWRAGSTEAGFARARVSLVSAGYFKALGLPLLQGRDFDEVESSNPRAARAIVIDEFTARGLFQSKSAIGQQIILGTERSTAYSVVGVVRALRDPRLEVDAPAQVYLPTAAVVSGYLVVTGSVDVSDLLRQARSAVARLDSEQALGIPVSLTAVLNRSLATSSLRAHRLTQATALGWFVALFGVAGVVVNSVVSRRLEFAIRFALGRTEHQLLRELVFEVTRLAVTACLIAAGAGWVAGKIITAVFAGISGWYPGLFLSLGILFSALAILAAYATGRAALSLNAADLLRQ